MCGQWKKIKLVLLLCSLSVLTVHAQNTPKQTEPQVGQKLTGNIITLSDGYSFEVDEVWKQGDDTWYRIGNVRKQLSQPVKSVKPIFEKIKPEPAAAEKTAKAATPQPATKSPETILIHLVDGAQFRVNEVREESDGAWYTRNNVSIFLAKERISSIEYETPATPVPPGSRNRDWTSGSPVIDQLIRINGDRFGIDPYLVFLVIEKESRFHPRALSPKGAMGLMQLMPGTARRLGVRKPYDPVENIRAGTQYMKELMDMFGGKVDLVLASYNAGEGAVLKYGRNVPPYRETRDYVKTIGKRYGLSGRQPAGDEVPEPQR